MKTLLVGTLAAASVAAIIFLTPAPALAWQTNAQVCTMNVCEFIAGGHEQEASCAWTAQGPDPDSGEYGLCSCPVNPNLVNPCPLYSNPY
jgi:hypothetical protein